MHRIGNREPTYREIKDTKTDKLYGGVGPRVGRQIYNTRGPNPKERDRTKPFVGGINQQCTHPGCKTEERVWAHRLRNGEGPATWL